MGFTNPWPSGSSGRLVAAVVAFAINYACYFSEIYRGGIEAVPKGQTEAQINDDDLQHQRRTADRCV